MRSARRSPCPVACALDIIGDRWTLLVIRDLLLGRAQFKEFAESPERIATNILADRLARLMEHDLVEKVRLESPAGRDAYRLTRKGEALRPVVEAISAWGLSNLSGTAAKLRPKSRT